MKMFGMKGQWEVYKSEIRYEISTSPGQSGSPIIIKKDGDYLAIGIHTGGTNIFNYGLHFDDRVR